MKIEFQETNYEYGFTLKPETPQEFAQLLRLAKQSKREVPDIYTTFYSENPYCSISIKRLDDNRRISSLGNSKERR